MQFSSLGKTNVKVSKICLGTMTWGEQNTEAEAHSQLDLAFERGVNFVDAAEMYPVPPRPETQGTTEEFLGAWLAKRGRRDDVVLATKVAGPGDWLKHIRGGSRLNESHISRALEDSLKRLKTDYVDVYQLHWPERPTNYFGQLIYKHADASDSVCMRDTLLALKKHLNTGKIRHWGLSNETPWGVMTAVRLADELEMPAPVTIQNPYNLLNRSFEVGLAECSMHESVGLLAYSPLAFGVLSGKYIGGQKPEGARLTMYDRFTRYTHERSESATVAYKALAEQSGLSLAQLALAFINQQPFVTSNIIGATSIQQLEENLDSVDIELDSSTMKALDELHQTHTIPCP